MTHQEAFSLIKDKKALLIDVRELDEVSEGMAEPATWFSLYEMEEGNQKYEDFLKVLDKSKEIILYCRSGRRSGMAAQMLTEKGFKATNLGGFDDWAEAGLPVRKGP
ncbi:MAG: rhodanese-like domain-containing protein [Xanthomonadaceae bacterium]|nr:rhodanese-like domain-containing protein [Xanthomonadaceae bacterium]